MSTKSVNVTNESEFISDPVDSPLENFVFVIHCQGDPTKAGRKGLKCRLELVPREMDFLEDLEDQADGQPLEEPDHPDDHLNKVEEDRKNDDGESEVKSKEVVDAQDTDHPHEKLTDPAEIQHSRFWAERTRKKE